jgi:hypothetical protein
MMPLTSSDPDALYGPQEWKEAVERADSQTLTIILRQTEERAEMYERWSEECRQRAAVIVAELIKRERKPNTFRNSP